MEAIERTELSLVRSVAAERLGDDCTVWVRGRCPFEGRKVLVVVGARRHSRYGARVCRDLIYGLANAPVVVVSGLAFGIDAIAHRAALEVGLPTVGVPGSGLDEQALYPREHRRLMREIETYGGCLLSPFPPKQRGAPWTFPARNRLMAALADAVVVVEGSERSGTMITAHAAAELGVSVGAVPGDVAAPLSAAPHRLIREGATLVRGAADCLELLGFAEVSAARETRQGEAVSWRDASVPLPERVAAFVEEQGSASRDHIAMALGLSVQEVARIVSLLEVEGMVRDEGGVVRRVAVS